MFSPTKGRESHPVAESYYYENPAFNYFNGRDGIRTRREEGEPVELSMVISGKDKVVLPIENFLQPSPSTIEEVMNEEIFTPERQILRTLGNIEFLLDRITRLWEGKRQTSLLKAGFDWLAPPTFDEYSRETQKEYFTQVLNAAGGNQTRAAALAGMKKSTFMDHINRLGTVAKSKATSDQ